METITNRQLHILRICMEQKETITGNDLSNLLNVSSKTVRNEIKVINEAIKDVAYIQSLPSKGYVIDIRQPKELQVYLNHQSSRESFVPSNSLERAYYILGILLKEEAYMKIDDLSEALFIDRTSVSRSLKYIRECLDRFGLRITQKSGQGIKIVGDEFRYRQCMAEYLYHKPEVMATEIGKDEAFLVKLKSKIFDDGITMPERVFQNFIIHMQVQLDRIQEGHPVVFTDDEKGYIKGEYEHIVARDCAQLLFEFFQVSLSEHELLYLTIQLLGKKSNSTSAIESCIDNQLRKEIDDVVQRIFNRIQDIFGIDFNQDVYLRKSIGIHVNPMENRLRYNTYLRNPLLFDIKEEYTFAYILSLEAWKVISNYLKCVNVEDEIAYLAIHFHYALERQKRSIPKKKVLLVNDYSVAASELLSFSILKKYNQSLVIEHTIYTNELQNYALDQYDYILSTVAIKQEVPIPIIRIQPIVSNEHLDALKPYFEQTLPHRLYEYLNAKNLYCEMDQEDPQSVFQFLYQREQKQNRMCEEDFYHIDPLLGFELSNQLAIHYIITTRKHCEITLLSLKRPIIWKNKMVKVVLLLHIGLQSAEMSDMMDALHYFMKDAKQIERLLQAKTKQECLSSIVP